MPDPQDATSAIALELAGRSAWVVSRIETYRALAASLPSPQDVVWEIGAAQGLTTLLIADRAHAVHAVEKAPETLARLRAATAQRANVHVVEMDALRETPSGARADLLLVDIGGDAPSERALMVAETWAAALHCSRLLLRNTKLHQALSSSVARAASPVNSVGVVARAAPPVDSVSVVGQATSPVAVDVDVQTLVSALRESRYRDRKRLLEALSRLGPTAVPALRALVEDRSAPLAARRAAAEALGRIGRESEGIAFPLADSGPLLRCLLGGSAVEPPRLLEMLAEADELARFAARRALRRGGERVARGLVHAMAGEGATMQQVVRGLEALEKAPKAPPEAILNWGFEAVRGEKQVWRGVVAAATLGIADQKWGKDLLAALESTWPADTPSPIPHLLELHAALQRDTKPVELQHLLDQVIAAGIDECLLLAAAECSPHQRVRRLGQLVDTTCA